MREEEEWLVEKLEDDRGVDDDLAVLILPIREVTGHGSSPLPEKNRVKNLQKG